MTIRAASYRAPAGRGHRRSGVPPRRHRPQLPTGPDDAAGSEGGQSAGFRRRTGRLGGAIRLGQVDIAPHRRLAGETGPRRGVPQRAACGGLDDERRTAIRRTNMGFVYQYHHLLPEFSAEENVVLPQMIAGMSRHESRARARELLGLLGLADRLDHRPGQLSGGEQQRVAIARALANRPKIVLADEPTGNLDPATADEVFDLLLELAREARLAAVIATHNPSLAARMDRTVRLEDGHLLPE